MYEVRCLRCGFTAEVETLGRVFRLEEAHKTDAGERHILEWEETEASPGSEPTEAERAAEMESGGESGEMESAGE